MHEEPNYLLSCMSPKVNKNIKTSSSKKISKLSLKKTIRRSSIYDKLPHTLHNNVTISVSDPTESDSVDSTNLQRCTDTPACSEYSYAVMKAKIQTETPISKMSNVRKWIAEVNANKNNFYDYNSDINSCNVSVFSELSAICVDVTKGEQTSDTSSILAANSTFVDNKNGVRFDEMFSTKAKTDEIKKYKCIIQAAVPPIKITDSDMVIKNSLNSCASLVTPVKSTAQMEEHEKILNEMYGHSWRPNKEKILTPSTEIKNDSVENLEKYVSQAAVVPSNEISDSIIVIDDSANEDVSFVTPVKTTAQVEEHEKILDELYGHSWRSNKEKVFTPNDLKKLNIRTKVYPKSEIKPKVSVTYKNPYSYNEISKSNNLLRSVHIDRIQKSASSWINRLRDVCDSDNSLENLSPKSLTACKIRLNFDDSCSCEETHGVNTPGKSDSEKIKSTKQRKILNDVEDNSGSNEEKNHVVTDEIEKENTRSKIKIDLNSKVLEERFNKISKPARSKNNINPVISDDKMTESFLTSLSKCTPSDRCDPSARIYRSTYKTSKADLAKKLFDLYNERIFDNSIPSDTPLEWNDRMRGTAGFCYCRKIKRRTGAMERSVRIVLATKVLDSADRLRDTLVHEMCHAATWIVNEISDGHGSFWKAWANKAMSTFPELPRIERCHDYHINTKYTYKCSDCGYSIGRHSKSLDIERKRCGYCYGKFEVFINKVAKNGVHSVTPVTPKNEVTGFALYVKENYATAKTENMKHADVMRSLSKRFKELKTK